MNNLNILISKTLVSTTKVKDKGIQSPVVKIKYENSRKSSKDFKKNREIGEEPLGGNVGES